MRNTLKIVCIRINQKIYSKERYTNRFSITETTFFHQSSIWNDRHDWISFRSNEDWFLKIKSNQIKSTIYKQICIHTGFHPSRPQPTYSLLSPHQWQCDPGIGRRWQTYRGKAQWSAARIDHTIHHAQSQYGRCKKPSLMRRLERA